MENKGNSNKIILCIVFIILIDAIILGVYFFTNKDNNNAKTSNDNETHSEINSDMVSSPKLKLTNSSLDNLFYDSHNQKNIAYHVATLNGDISYSVDYGDATSETSSVKFRDYLSDQAMAVLINGYPNKTFESLGCLNEDEAYLATQMAFWEVMNRTDESKKSTEIFRVENITSATEQDAAYNRITTAAQKLVELAETEPYSRVPTMNIHNGNVSSTFVDGDVLIGPYSVTISDDAEIQTIKASLLNAPASAKITDENGVPKTILSSGENVYVRLSTTEEATTFQIKFESNLNRIVGAVYEGSNQTTQDYAKLELIPIELEKELTIEFSKITTLGRIELVVGDKDKRPVVGAVFNLIDSHNNILMEVKTGKDGVVDFYSVPVGEYTLTQISAPSGYEIKEKSKKVTVKPGELSTVTFEN